MALWKDSTTGTSSAPSPGATPAPTPPREPERTNVASLTPDTARRPAPAPAPAPTHRSEVKESHIAADLTIEGKIIGTGHVRIAGRFKGDVQVDGNVSLEAGARLEGHVKAGVVSVGGELIGNIENAKRVELLETGVINGDVKAGSLTVAAGSRMRGQVEFGYEGETRAKGETKGFGNA
jgi:cytoskeletal protein CcmA (bactofilin family)